MTLSILINLPFDVRTQKPSSIRIECNQCLVSYIIADLLDVVVFLVAALTQMLTFHVGVVPLVAGIAVRFAVLHSLLVTASVAYVSTFVLIRELRVIVTIRTRILQSTLHHGVKGVCGFGFDRQIRSFDNRSSQIKTRSILPFLCLFTSCSRWRPAHVCSGDSCESCEAFASPANLSKVRVSARHTLFPAESTKMHYK